MSEKSKVEMNPDHIRSMKMASSYSEKDGQPQVNIFELLSNPLLVLHEYVSEIDHHVAEINRLSALAHQKLAEVNQRGYELGKEKQEAASESKTAPSIIDPEALSGVQIKCCCSGRR